MTGNKFQHEVDMAPLPGVLWCGTSSAPVVGLVEMQKYSDWLRGQGVNIDFAVPSNPHPCN